MVQPAYRSVSSCIFSRIDVASYRQPQWLPGGHPTAYPASCALFDVSWTALGGGRSATTSTTLYFIIAGVFLGLTQYTYTAVRLFPFLIMAIVIMVWLFDRQRVTDNLGNLALMALVASLVFLPLGYYFWQNPQDFFGRAAQIFSIFTRIGRWQCWCALYGKASRKQLACGWYGEI